MANPTSESQLQLFASSAASSPCAAPSSQPSSEPKPSSKRSKPSAVTAGPRKRRARARSTPVSVAFADGLTGGVVPTVALLRQLPLRAGMRLHTPDPMLAIPRPQTRGECLQEARPCPWASCRYHLLLEEAESSETPPAAAQSIEEPNAKRPRTLRLNTPHRQGGTNGRPRGLSSSDGEAMVRVWTDDAMERLASMPATCALDIADENPDGINAVEIAKLLGVTEQAIELELRKPRVRHAIAQLKIREGFDAI
jgi:hypothetical protein